MEESLNGGDGNPFSENRVCESSPYKPKHLMHSSTNKHSLQRCGYVPVPGIPGTGNFQERKTFRKKIPQRKTEKKPYGTYRYENVTKVWVGDECAPSELRSQAETQIQAQYDTVTQIQYDPNTQEHKYSMTQIHKNTNTV